MSTDTTIHAAGKKLKLHVRLSILTLVIGVALMIRQMYADDEPGAIPLLLIVLGIGWYLLTRWRIRPHRQTTSGQRDG